MTTPYSSNTTMSSSNSTTNPMTTLSSLNTTSSSNSTTNPMTTLSSSNTTTSSSNSTTNAITSPASTTPTQTPLSSSTTQNFNTTVPSTISTTTTPQSTIAPTRNNTISTTSITPSRSTSGTSTTVTTTTEDPQSVVNQLLDQSSDFNSMNSSQVQNLVNKLEDVLSAPNISSLVGEGAISVINKLLDAPQSTVASSSNRLIKVVDALAMKLVLSDSSVKITRSSLAMEVVKIDGTNFPGMSFSMNDPSDIAVKNRKRRSVASPVGSITLPASLTNGLTPEQKKQASRLQFTFFQKTTLFEDKYNNKTLNSLVLGMSVANQSIRDLSDHVQISLKNTNTQKGNRTCVFWDFNKNGGAGGWNTSGCSLVNSTDTDTTCSCNHLTSFAVLLDLSRDTNIDQVQSTILTFISFIGCGISSIFLAITLLTYLGFDKLRRDIPSKILIHLCFALFLLNMTFLLDSWLALYKDAVGLCISTAFFLHYFLLASFTWMGLEALHLYLSVVKVFRNFVSHYMLKFSLAGWGIPLIVVIIVISVDKNNYGLVQYAKYANATTDDFCWFKNNIAYYVSVVAYFCAIFVVNMIMFVVVMVQLRRIKRQNPHNSKYRNGLQDLRSVAGLVVLLGLTWGFAFFAWGPLNLPFMYLFSIFNSFQGLFIFVFHCAIKQSVQRQWRIYLCCGKFRIGENSDWSRVAQNKSKVSVTTTHLSISSNNSTPSRTSSMSGGSLEVPSSFRGSPGNDSGLGSFEESNNLMHRRSVR
ncbi:adhesion G-protein coupled receptor G2 [Clarias gariepinus]|uniref:adhesion G-protein coupled receptor G2 n=1 Tax=Clarias gariepinus TaxID=13013 RepID=UPI00234C36B3|nr:adhesion G-protein coupled receptor G2 [Clarias gariepinus]